MTDLDARARLLHPIPGMRWTEVRDAAVEFARNAWPVLPGTYQHAEHARWLGKAQSAGLEPVDNLWTEMSTTDPTIAMDRWSARPYSVLLACGAGIDAIETPATLGEIVLNSLRAAKSLGPVAMTPFGTWLLFVKAGVPLHPQLAGSAGIMLHSRAAWVPLPPTALGSIPYRWKISPSAVSWTLPRAQAVQDVLRAASAS